jgi:hypothetical protein
MFAARSASKPAACSALRSAVAMAFGVSVLSADTFRCRPRSSSVSRNSHSKRKSRNCCLRFSVCWLFVPPFSWLKCVFSKGGREFVWSLWW